ncbi:MAG: AAA family ATPase [Anaerolineae bacterium]|nr:AAA family ATPase [Anaerolineae bacterium]
MKQLTRIRLINWHLFEDVTIPCRGTTYFIGVNGVGKSTILDAVQFALVGGQRDVRFNRAAMSGSRRTLAGYVRGELGTEGQRFLRAAPSARARSSSARSDWRRFARNCSTCTPKTRRCASDWP